MVVIRASVALAMRVHVAFTPGELTPAPVGIVVDVLRATSTICQALASGYRRVLCCAEVDEARALAETEGPAKLAGEPSISSFNLRFFAAILGKRR